MFPLYYLHSNIFSMFNSSTTSVSKGLIDCDRFTHLMSFETDLISHSIMVGLLVSVGNPLFSQVSIWTTKLGCCPSKARSIALLGSSSLMSPLCITMVIHKDISLSCYFTRSRIACRQSEIKHLRGIGRLL